eukprot:7583294-Alexandrium_andersonii.AAC.1
MAHSAPGPDGWEAEDLHHMSLVAATALAAILNRVEEGCAWPHQLTLARSVFLAKGTGSDMLDPLQYRILTICAH